MDYKFTTEKKMLEKVDLIEKNCKEQGFYYLGEGIAFMFDDGKNEKYVRIKLFEGFESFLSVAYHFEKGDDNHNIVSTEYFRYPLGESKKAFNKMRELLVEHKGRKI